MKKLLFAAFLLVSTQAFSQMKKKPSPHSKADSIAYQKRLLFKKRSDSAYRADAAKIPYKTKH